MDAVAVGPGSARIAMTIRDAHTHRRDAEDAVISITPGEEMRPGHLYSVGIHPWDADKPYDIDTLEAQARSPQVVAIGEAGLDGACGVDEDRQMEAFILQAQLAERLGKPLIVHCVRRLHLLLPLRREWRCRQPWIIHGYRGKPETTRQLLADEGIYFSIGERRNDEALAIIPPERLLFETDESAMPIEEIVAGRNALGYSVFNRQTDTDNG